MPGGTPSNMYDMTGGLYSRPLYGCMHSMKIVDEESFPAFGGGGSNERSIDFVNDVIGGSDAAVGTDACSAITTKATARPTYR